VTAHEIRSHHRRTGLGDLLRAATARLADRDRLDEVEADQLLADLAPMGADLPVDKTTGTGWPT